MQAFRSFVAAQPNDVPFVFAYKGKYIVQVTKSTEGSQHVNAFYYVDNSQNLVDHDFEAGVPAAGQLTIEKTSHITPGSTAAFATELNAFLVSVGLANISLTAGRAFNWYDAIAAYYEAPVYTISVLTDTEDTEILTLEDQWGGVVCPKVTINGVTGYLKCGASHQISEDLSADKSCPVPDSVLANLISTDPVSFEHTDAVYEFVKDSCSLGDFFTMRLVPSENNLPDINMELIYDDTRKLRGLFALGSFRIATIDSPTLELLQQRPVIVSVNGIPAKLTLVDADNMRTEVLSDVDNQQIQHFNMPTLHGAILCSDFRADDLFADVDDWADQTAISLGISNNESVMVTSGFDWNQVEFAQEY